MSFDLARAIRAIKPQRKRAALTRRSDGALTWVSGQPRIGGPLLLDTTVYVDVASGRSPVDLDELLKTRTLYHSSVALAELTHAFGRLDPGHPDTRTSLRVLGDTIADIPAHRLFDPEVDVWGAAGMLAGAFARLSGAAASLPGRSVLNDALLYLQARKLGCALLSGNVRDFDLLNQLMPDGAVLLYRW